MGPPEFSIPSLKILKESNYKIVCVYTQSPKKKSRGQKILKNAVHVFAENEGIKVNTNNLNNAISGTELEGKSIEDICSTPNLSAAVRNNGGGYYNHCLFWEVMSPNGGGNPTGEIADAINTQFGSFENFKSEFSKAAGTRFGSGWACFAKKKDLSVYVLRLIKTTLSWKVSVEEFRF